MEENKNQNGKNDNAKKIETLSGIGVNSIYAAYRIVGILLIVITVACFIGGIVLGVKMSNGQTYSSDENTLAYILILMVAVPIVSLLVWIVLRVVFGCLFDVKLIRYKLFGEKDDIYKLVEENETTEKPENRE